jgi:hypothetical protein
VVELRGEAHLLEEHARDVRVFCELREHPLERHGSDRTERAELIGDEHFAHPSAADAAADDVPAERHAAAGSAIADAVPEPVHELRSDPVVVSIIAAVVLGAASTSACESARAEYEALSLESALDKAEAELAASREQPIDCLEVKALSLMVLGRLDEARAVFAELFARDVEHIIRDRSLSPAQLQAIEEIREKKRPISATVKARWLVHELLRLDVVLSGGIREASHVEYEIDLGEFDTKTRGVVPLVGRVATATASIPAEIEVGSLVMSGRVIDRGENLIHRFEKEMILPARPAPPPRVEGDDGGAPWFLWAAIGAGLIGATVAIAVLAQPRGPDCADGLGCGPEVP